MEIREKGLKELDPALIADGSVLVCGTL